ncbi:polysaccharide biosynthesis tyrosine autokinase [Arthrobacter zhaoxinii]|uniref:polysaccharide biosynthesis tyrosine autokinase n=1 Tax=Arthrobacter zhaoxinii TaxID=2964616 RepID=UPI002105B90E|nr:polysaccharide biosynthesis tyrosine autokinase [Arthrobacter zhaoxinii]MCQ2001759.1 polysaccharide biosynthesis tyrosine autokinase [Arthrobacter zhaoxinii]
MELRDYVAAMRNQWLLILCIAVAGILVGLGTAALTPASYRATSSVFVSVDRGQTTSELVQGSTYTQNIVQSYTQLVTTPKVLDPVIEDLDLETTAQTLASHVTAETPLNTVLIDIKAVDASAEGAAEIANSVAASLSETVAELSPAVGQDQRPPIELTVVTRAQTPGAPFEPNIRLLLSLGFLGGLVLGVLVALGRELVDTRVRNSTDIERVTKLPVIASVSRNRNKKSSQLAMRSNPHSHVAESYRLLATNLEYIDPDRQLKSILVSSPMPGEGKTTIAINLALAVAEHTNRVLLIDADLRRPAVAPYCGIQGDVGLTTVLSGNASAEEAIERWSGVDILPSGPVPPNPTQLLSSNTMASIVRDLVARYDFVVIDSPPILPVADALPLARLAEGTLLVARRRKTRRQQLARAQAALENVGASTVGVVLTMADADLGSTYYGSYPDSGVGKPGAEAWVPPTEPRSWRSSEQPDEPAQTDGKARSAADSGR